MAPADRPTDGSSPGAESAGPSSLPDPGRQLRHGIAGLVILAVLVVALLFAVPGLKGVGHALRHADLTWVWVAIAFEVLSNVGYELVVMLVFPEAPRRFAGRLAWAESAFGAAVSIGGAGNIGLGAWVLHTLGISNKTNADRSASLFLATSAVNVIVLAVTGLAVAAGVLSGPSNVLLTLVPGIVAVLGLALFLGLPKIAEHHQGWLSSHRRLGVSVRTTAEGVQGAKRILLTTEWLTVGAWAYLLCDIAVLWFCLHALGSSPPFGALILAYQIGYIANAIPVPGGIGVLDAGLVAMLVVYGVRSTPAAAAEVAYHAIALWVPASIGTIAFILLRRQIASGNVGRRVPVQTRSAKSAELTPSVGRRDRDPDLGSDAGEAAGQASR